MRALRRTSVPCSRSGLEAMRSALIEQLCGRCVTVADASGKLAGAHPCDGAGAERVTLFREWMDAGYQPIRYTRFS